MAKRWRIRHKLMLGLALAVGILALLLAGTVRGLWSYWVTNNTIHELHKELRAAEDFNEAVTKLVTPDSLEALGHNVGLVHEATTDARRQLDAYEKLLKDGLNQRYDPDNKGAHALGLIEVLRENLDRLEAAFDQFGREPLMSGPSASEQARLDPTVARSASVLILNASDLRNTIYDDLGARVGKESQRHYQIAFWIVVPSSVVGLLLMLGLTRSFYTWIFYPIRDLEAGVSRVARGDFAHRIEVKSGDEMEDLANAFNDMTQRLQTLYADLARQVNERSRQLVRSERLASVGFLAAGVAHEINNPLASILFCSEALEARLNDLFRKLMGTLRKGDDLEVFARYLKMIQEESLRCKNITERLLAFSRSGERKRETIDLAQLVQSVLDVTQHLQNCKGKQIDFDRPTGGVTAPVNGQEIKSVILNLVVNALDSMDEGGHLTIRLRQQDGMAELDFSDTGCGMSQEVQENIFEPFFTRSRTGKGTGLGLTISHRIITQHGGEIEASSAGPNQGSTFTVRLPLHLEEAAPPSDPGRGRRPLAA